MIYERLLFPIEEAKKDTNTLELEYYSNMKLLFDDIIVN